MSSALHTAYGIAGTASNTASSLLSFVPGLGGSTPAESTSRDSSDQPSSGDNSMSGSSASLKVKTLADQRAEAARKEDQQAEFYNGNSSAFEGRKDDEDGRKKD